MSCRGPGSAEEFQVVFDPIPHRKVVLSGVGEVLVSGHVPGARPGMTATVGHDKLRTATIRQPPRPSPTT